MAFYLNPIEMPQIFPGARNIPLEERPAGNYLKKKYNFTHKKKDGKPSERERTDCEPKISTIAVGTDGNVILV